MKMVSSFTINMTNHSPSHNQEKVISPLERWHPDSKVHTLGGLIPALCIIPPLLDSAVEWVRNCHKGLGTVRHQGGWGDWCAKATSWQGS